MWFYFTGLLGLFLFSSLLLILCKRQTRKKDLFDFLSEGFHPLQELPSPEIFLPSYFFLFEQDPEMINLRYFHSRIETVFAKYVTWLLNEKIFFDSPMNLKYTIKLETLYNAYITMWNQEMQKEVEVSFAQELVETLWENDVNLYQIYNEIYKVFKKEPLLISAFEDYIRNKQKIILNYPQLKRNRKGLNNFFDLLKNIE